MNTVTIGKDGHEREVTQEEFVELNAVNDELTDFLATTQDLFTIVDALLKHIPDTTYWLHLCVSSSELAYRNWLTQRWTRLMDYMETKYPDNTATYETRMTAELNATMAAVNKDRAAG